MFMSLSKFSLSIAIALLGLAITGSSAHAGLVQVNFSGGSGTPLTITLPQPVSYTVTGFPGTAGEIFVFQGTGHLLSGNVGAGGSLSFTQNAGAPNSINNAIQLVQDNVTLNDLDLYDGSPPGLNHNDVFLLSAGSVTTTTNIAAAAPPSGLYSTILTDGSGLKTGDGTALPEPAALSLLALAAPILLARRRTAA
jgi:hypothetical protein